MKKWNLLLVLVLALSLSLVVVGCSDDDDDDNPVGTPDPTAEEVAVGTWWSTGDNVAPLLVAVFNYDSVEVVFGDNNTVSLNSHVTDGAWTGAINGTYTIDESETGTIHSISLVYPTFEQEGIVEFYDNDTMMRLEVVQTNPDIGATPLTPDDGFGADASLGTTNIQVYERQ